MLIGYARISRAQDQTDRLQLAALKKAGCRRIHRDQSSGDRADRAGLEKAIDSLKPGDVLVVWKIDRLSRSLSHLIHTIRRIDERKARFRSLTDAIDTSTAGGAMQMHIIGAIAEFELRLIRERTKAGTDAARAAGRIGGRRRRLAAAQEKAAVKMIEDKTDSIPAVAAVFGVSSATMNRILRRHRDARLRYSILLTKGSG